MVSWFKLVLPVDLPDWTDSNLHLAISVFAVDELLLVEYGSLGVTVLNLTDVFYQI